MRPPVVASRSPGAVRRATALVTALATWLVPAIAAACPYCAGRNDGGIGRGIALTLFVLLPFAVAYVVIRFIRSGEAAVQKAIPRAEPPFGLARGALPSEPSS